MTHDDLVLLLTPKFLKMVNSSRIFLSSKHRKHLTDREEEILDLLWDKCMYSRRYVVYIPTPNEYRYVRVIGLGNHLQAKQHIVDKPVTEFIDQYQEL